jgi:hypothetical protein
MRRVVLLPILLMFAFGVGSATLVVRDLDELVVPSSMVYSVSEVTTGLILHPNVWVGRRVLVRGVVVSSLGDLTGRCLPPGCAAPASYILVASVRAFGGIGPGMWVSGSVARGTAAAPAHVPPALVLIAAPPSKLVEALRQLPLVRLLLPWPQTVHFLHMATYRVRLQLGMPSPMTAHPAVSGYCSHCGPSGVLL